VPEYRLFDPNETLGPNPKIRVLTYVTALSSGLCLTLPVITDPLFYLLAIPDGMMQINEQLCTRAGLQTASRGEREKGN